MGLTSPCTNYLLTKNNENERSVPVPDLFLVIRSILVHSG